MLKFKVSNFYFSQLKPHQPDTRFWSPVKYLANFSFLSGKTKRMHKLKVNQSKPTQLRSTIHF